MTTYQDDRVTSLLPADQHRFGVENGYAPLAHNVVLVDFDSTLRPWGSLMDTTIAPVPGAIAAVKELVVRGYAIYIFTSRMSRQWAASVVGPEIDKQTDFLQKQYDFVADFCVSNGIAYVDIIAEKIPAIAYIDDRAIGFRGDWSSVLNDPLVVK